MRTDVTEKFPFLVTRMSPYYDRKFNIHPLVAVCLLSEAVLNTREMLTLWVPLRVCTRAHGILRPPLESCTGRAGARAPGHVRALQAHG